MRSGKEFSEKTLTCPNIVSFEFHKTRRLYVQISQMKFLKGLKLLKMSIKAFTSSNPERFDHLGSTKQLQSVTYRILSASLLHDSKSIRYCIKKSQPNINSKLHPPVQDIIKNITSRHSVYHENLTGSLKKTFLY